MNRQIFTVMLAALAITGQMAEAQSVKPVTAYKVADNVVSGGDMEIMRYAVELYRHGMYAKALELFQTMPEDPLAQGYAVLCEIKMRVKGYERTVVEYASDFPYSGMMPQIYFAYALNLFDDGDYYAASEEFAKVNKTGLYEDQTAEFTFKRAYSDFRSGRQDKALEGFMKVIDMPKNDYQAPSEYSVAYIWYERENFPEALKWFEKSRKDQRFADVSSYYIMECRFMIKDYRYVTDHAAEMYSSVPEARRPHLARIISESYLVQGDAETAKQYYDKADTVVEKGRSDYFYAGSLLYALQDYRGAIGKYSMMTDRTDSIGQVANYQMAYSYIQTKNKVAAMQSFKDAASVAYNTDIQEDAYFNHAKLAFDLNNDPSVFDSYMKKYPELAKGDRIYSYMALASLYNHDYAGAVESYDKIDVLDADMKNNYMKANYLRAQQLIEAGSWRKAIPCLRTASYYSEKTSPFNQMARYWTAESYYRSDDYDRAAELFTNLYNNSALDTKTEGKLLPYDMAYCHFKSEDYEDAEKWFSMYVESGDTTFRRDALIRLGDTYFIRKNYSSAMSSYRQAIMEYPQLDDLYPYYQTGVCCSLTDSQKEGINVLSATVEASSDASYYCETEYELGRAYMSVDDNENAKKVFLSLSENGKDSTYRARALIGLGLISANESQFDDALGYYKQVVSDMPSTEYSEDALRAIESIYQTKQEPEKYFAYLNTVSDGEKVQGTDREAMFFNSAEQIFLAENYSKAITSLQAYMEEYPHGENENLADFYMAESYRNLDKKEQACEWYKKVIESGEGSFVEVSSLTFAKLSFELQKYDDAYSGYQSLLENARIENNKSVAIVGMMNSAYAGKNYEKAVAAASGIASGKQWSEDDIRRARYVEAKSYLAMSERDKAFEILSALAESPSTPEGAEAAYMMAQDAYDQGKFEEVESLVYKFSDSGSGQTYWLAKAYVVLGDSFAERGEYSQAKATFESIRDGYVPTGPEDEILDSVDMRLKKLSETE